MKWNVTSQRIDRELRDEHGLWCLDIHVNDNVECRFLVYNKSLLAYPIGKGTNEITAWENFIAQCEEHAKKLEEITAYAKENLQKLKEGGRTEQCYDKNMYDMAVDAMRPETDYDIKDKELIEALKDNKR